MEHRGVIARAVRGGAYAPIATPPLSVVPPFSKLKGTTATVAKKSSSKSTLKNFIFRGPGKRRGLGGITINLLHFDFFGFDIWVTVFVTICTMIIFFGHR